MGLGWGAQNMGGGVIWHGVPFETPVIPAKAGIQPVDSAFPKVWGVDSRFRGNDCDLQRSCLANDNSTRDLQNAKKRQSTVMLKGFGSYIAILQKW